MAISVTWSECWLLGRCQCHTSAEQHRAKGYPQLSESLLAINARVVDLLPIARERYYHPSQQGSWSIKKVLPAVVPLSLPAFK